MTSRRIQAWFTPALLLATLAGLVALRVRLVDDRVGTYLGCEGCFDTMVVTADAALFAAVAGLLLLAGLARPHWLGRVLQLAAGGVLLVHAADLVVFRLFSTRLFLSDVQLFVREPAAVWDQFSSGLGGTLPGLAVLAAVVALLAWLAIVPPARSQVQRGLLAAGLVAALLLTAFARTGVYVNDWAVDNVFAANLATGAHRPYSATFAEAAVARLPPQRTVTGPAPGRDRNVIVVMLESWSAWHSAAWGGDEDWTPRLDAAARRGTAFTDFHAIGFSTDKGLVGILAGQQLWSPFLHFLETPPFHSMWGVERSLPRPFARQGHHTAFLTSGPLTLYRKGEWLDDLGFDEVEGNEHPFYANEPRYAFEAASDSALYARAAERLSSAPSPFLLVLETVSTHQPYIDPETGERSLERVMRFADRAFDAFLDVLDDRGYFDTGILLVVSDHRSMTPVPGAELERWGDAAMSRVPAFAIGEGFEPGSRDGRIYSQSDLVPSFELWLGGETRLGPHQRVMFGRTESAPDAVQTEQRRCVFHGRFDLRGQIDVHCPDGDGRVRLAGDDSRFVRVNGLDPATREDVLATLTALRLEALARHQRRERGQTAADTTP